MSKYTDDMRAFWSMPTFEQARDERVTVPPSPELYTDEYQDQILREVLGDIKLAPGQTILDYGCGVGRMTRALLRRGVIVVAADVSPAMLDYCRQYCVGLDGLRTVQTDGWGCPEIDDASIDGAVSFYCFQHMPTFRMVTTVLRDVHRVLKSGGWFVLHSTDHGIDFLDRSVGFLGVRQSAKVLIRAAANAGFAVGSPTSINDPQFSIELSAR
ncbi:MAG: class I SAM-dependent methyltransferase [Pirellulales bacterium]